MFSSQVFFIHSTFLANKRTSIDSKQRVIKRQQNYHGLNTWELTASRKALKSVKLAWFSKPHPWNAFGICPWTLPGGLQCPQQWLHLQLILPKSIFQNSHCFPQYRFSISSRNRPNQEIRTDYENNLMLSPRAS